MEKLFLLFAISYCFSTHSYSRTIEECQSDYENQLTEIQNPNIYSFRNAARDAEFRFQLCMNSAQMQGARAVEADRLRGAYIANQEEYKRRSLERMEEKKIAAEKEKEALLQRREARLAQLQIERTERENKEAAIQKNQPSGPIAYYRMNLDRLNGVDVMLSDTFRAGTEEKPSHCEMQGKRRVIMFSIYLSATNASLFATGCWYHQNGRVYLETTTTEDRKPFNIDFATSKFTTKNGFVSWDTYSKKR